MPSPSPLDNLTAHGGVKATVDWPQGRRARLLLGVRGAVPIMMGYIPIGLALGVLAARADLTPWEIGAMSMFVYAGASQFIGVSMLAADAAPTAIAATAFLVNLRHLLMGAALAPYMRHVRGRLGALLSFFITDESFAVSEAAFRERGRADVAYMVGLYGAAYVSWVLATLGGAVLGGTVSVPDGFPLDFALPAMFIGLLAGQLVHRRAVAVAVVAGVVAVFGQTVFQGWTVMVASVGAAAFGVGVGRWTNGSS